jgi:hypothetical protein
MAEVICPNCKTSFKVGNGENIVDTNKLSGTVELAQVGAVLQKIKNTFMIVEINKDIEHKFHILAGDGWLLDKALEKWEKVEE